MTTVETTDPLRERLLAAAARVFVRRGFESTRIQDIVREAGLTTGAAYPRFESKRDLVREALVAALSAGESPALDPDERVADFLARTGDRSGEPLGSSEALLIEACVIARRDTEIAAAVGDLIAAWHREIEPALERATSDGTLASPDDVEPLIYLFRALYLGTLVERGAGLDGLESERWRTTLERVLAAFAQKR